jgi:hypothetical protein
MIYFTAHTLKCVCHCRRVMFRVLGMYNFAFNQNWNSHFRSTFWKQSFWFTHLWIWKKGDFLTKILKVKGQIISKCLFGVFNFFQKTNENTSHSSKNKFICSFFEELTAWQFAFKISWPLVNLIYIQFSTKNGNRNPQFLL